MNFQSTSEYSSLTVGMTQVTTGRVTPTNSHVFICWITVQHETKDLWWAKQHLLENRDSLQNNVSLLVRKCLGYSRQTQNKPDKISDYLKGERRKAGDCTGAWRKTLVQWNPSVLVAPVVTWAFISTNASTAHYVQ